ncbi:Dolichyl-phosphate-mannose--protein mannosyltransferase 2 [Elasticomyces elasticus]|nr:Dolichyl-phosphate-mannose--protein mannosyltransferase 2 [Elasticomyces elasticus]KAK4990772.1 Dolichyl-phosphate-mannose--protein mannosyltransferase 2 [Elasticomyces elasticus]
MALQDQRMAEATTTGTDRQADELRRRNVPADQQNGSYVPIEVDEKTKQKAKSFLTVLDEYEYLIAPLIFTALAFFTRMWKIGLSPIVTWDEAQYATLLRASTATEVAG